jgi:hypothetical protein
MDQAAFNSRWRLRNAAASRPGPRMQSSRSKIEPQTAYGAFISYYFSDAALDERLSGQQRLLLLELSILAAGRGSC